MADEPQPNDEDQTWVLDSLVGFLKSPLWSSSLNDFTDRNSIVFDPDDIENEDGQVRHRSEYEAIFRQYRQLVDRLIGSHMTELGINEEQFARACQMAEGMLANKLKRILFEELWAAENYEVFVRLMAKRNVELQLEALEMLVRKYGLVYDVFVPIGTSPKNFLSEEHILREAIIRSLNDMELNEDDEDEEQDEDDEDDDKTKEDTSNTQEPESIKPESEQASKTTEESSSPDKDADKETVQRDAARLVEVKQKIDRKMAEALQLALANETEDDEQAEEEPIPSAPTESSTEEENVDKKSTKLEPQANQSKSNERRVSMEEIHKRADYLRRQRDKILQQRQKDRTERISKYLIKAEKNPSTPRPRTASKQETETTSNPDNQQHQQTLAFRKALAARLKSEVIMGGQK